MHRSPLFVAGFIFALVALVHLDRLIFGFSIAINGQELPGWVSVIGFIVAGALSYWMFRSAKCQC